MEGKAKDKKWTAEELRLYKYPIQGLAAAVVKQWRRDGSPKNCDIEPWLNLLSMEVHKNDSRNEENEVPK